MNKESLLFTLGIVIVAALCALIYDQTSSLGKRQDPVRPPSTDVARKKPKQFALKPDGSNVEDLTDVEAEGSVSAVQLMEAYKKDSVAADTMYGGRVYLISGLVGEVTSFPDLNVKLVSPESLTKWSLGPEDLPFAPHGLLDEAVQLEGVVCKVPRGEYEYAVADTLMKAAGAIFKCRIKGWKRIYLAHGFSGPEHRKKQDQAPYCVYAEDCIKQQIDLKTDIKLQLEQVKREREASKDK
jgi:hypothetical protein